MSVVPTAKVLFKATPNLVILGASLFMTYLTLGGKVRKARRAFEKQLVAQGMSKEDAQRLSACYNELKNSLIDILKRGITVNPTY